MNLLRLDFVVFKIDPMTTLTFSNIQQLIKRMPVRKYNISVLVEKISKTQHEQIRQAVVSAQQITNAVEGNLAHRLIGLAM